MTPTITDRRAIEVTRGAEEKTQRLGFAVESEQGGMMNWFTFANPLDAEPGPFEYLGDFPSAAEAYRAIQERDQR